MRELVLAKGKRALVVVAHPDDETIWMGGTILKNPNVRWTIFSLCRKSDQDRAPKFRRVCRRYGARAIITDLEDAGIMNAKESIPKIEELLRTYLGGESFHYIFTHGKNGEYGHPRHIGVDRAMRNTLERGQLRGDEIFFFSYRADTRKRIHNVWKHGVHGTKLTREELKSKRDIIKNLYGFSKKSFENVSCLARETFSHV